MSKDGASGKTKRGPGESEASRDEEEKALSAHEAGQRLAALGGTMPNLTAPPRRRPPRFVNDDAETE